jgi:16S rRNA U516 pseudouridylate synthase RsuA-like enzyme
MIASFGNRVTSLERVEFAEIPLDDSLRRGEWRYLTENEINMLKSKVK